MKCEPDSPASMGVMDRSRILLCALTFLCLSLNPLPSLLGPEARSGPEWTPAGVGHVPSRTMLGFSGQTQSFGERRDDRLSNDAIETSDGTS